MLVMEFKIDHIPQAMELARVNYEMERKQVTMLPEVEKLPELEHFTENGLGVAAMEGDKLLGYLCAYYPREDVFGTTNVKGTFSPIHAHGVVRESGIDGRRRGRIYSLLYQEAAKRWVQAGIRSHAIAIYKHDQDAVNSFFYNGFGLRCIDAINSIDELSRLETITLQDGIAYEYVEVPRTDWSKLLLQHNELRAHLGNSPTFMKFDRIDVDGLYREASDDVRYFSVKVDGEYVAYLKVGVDGENFATQNKSMMNICGAYCVPSYRGKGIYLNLLVSTVKILKSEGYRLLGVDCESFNPNARGFWLKYFHEYTHSVVRRIDDKIFL